MAGIDKDYYTLEEIAARWDMPDCDLAYLAENGLLKVSVRLYGIRLETGEYEEVAHGQCCAIPGWQGYFDGLRDLRPQDLYRLFHEGQVTVDQLLQDGDEYCHILRPEEGMAVRRDELVVRREERDRLEAVHGLRHEEGGLPGGFRYSADYSRVHLEGRSWNLGSMQAKVVGILHCSVREGAPWRHGKRVLQEAGSSSARMSDLFKRQRHWRDLIASDGRGRYRLNSDS